jgi:hypothetical protein
MMIYDFEVTLLWTSSTVCLEMQYYVSECSSASVFRQGMHLTCRTLKKSYSQVLGPYVLQAGLGSIFM